MAKGSDGTANVGRACNDAIEMTLLRGGPASCGPSGVVANEPMPYLSGVAARLSGARLFVSRQGPPCYVFCV